MMGFGFGSMGWLSMLIFWVVIIALAVWMLGKLFPQVADTPPPQPRGRREDSVGPALEVLEQRYARGEITKSEYEAIRRDLQ